jgi:prepilin-type N-terminal cleavage/methylation domain-containing protein
VFTHSNRAHDDRGFTLIELLIVIVVLGILSGIVLFGVSTLKSDSKGSACKADKANVETALETYKAKNGSYPTYTADQSALITGGFMKEKADHVNSWGTSGVTAGIATTTDCT